MKQVKQKQREVNLQNIDLKDDVRIKIINSSNARMWALNKITIAEDENNKVDPNKTNTS